MEQSQFEQMVARLELESQASPGAYQAKVAALALLGFMILGLIIAVAGLGLLLIVGLAIATLFTGGKALILVFKFGKLLLLLAIPLWLLVKSSVSALLTRLPAPSGLEIRRAQVPALFAALDTMRERMKGPRFHHVLITDDMNAAMVQRPLFGLMGWPRNYLILGLPLLEVLSPEEALAVVAHEYGHLAGSHSRFGAFIYRLRLTWGTIQELSSQWQGWASRPMQRVVQWYAPYFNAYTFVLARLNEYQADAASAELVGAGVAASALKRVNIAAPQYDHFVEKTFETIRDAGRPPKDLALQWAAQAHQAPAADKSEAWLGSALARESQVSDTHPALRERLLALPGQGEHSAELPAPLAAASAATAWLGAGAADLRETLQREWHDRVAEPWAERHQELQQQLKRLQELEASNEVTVPDQIERLRLAVALRPEQNHVEALASFNALHADQVLTIFLEAGERLAQDDETGLALLERTIALDPEACKPACEKAYAWLSRHNDERARVWADRWNERNHFEQVRDQQLHALDPAHELRPAELDEAQQQELLRLLRLGGKGVKRVWIARREVPADANALTFVLGVELSWWPALRGQQHAIVNRLSKLEWPLHLFICLLDRHNRKLRKKLKAVAGAELPFSL